MSTFILVYSLGCGLLFVIAICKAARECAKPSTLEFDFTGRGADAQRQLDAALRERDASCADAARIKETLADIIPALEVASRCKAEELRATCPGNALTPDEWAALWMSRAILEVASSNNSRFYGPPAGSARLVSSLAPPRRGFTILRHLRPFAGLLK